MTNTENTTTELRTAWEELQLAVAPLSERYTVNPTEDNWTASYAASQAADAAWKTYRAAVDGRAL